MGEIPQCKTPIIIIILLFGGNFRNGYWASYKKKCLEVFWNRHCCWDADIKPPLSPSLTLQADDRLRDRQADKQVNESTASRQAETRIDKQADRKWQWQPCRDLRFAAAVVAACGWREGCPGRRLAVCWMGGRSALSSHMKLLAIESTNKAVNSAQQKRDTVQQRPEVPTETPPGMRVNTGYIISTSWRYILSAIEPIQMVCYFNT